MKRILKAAIAVFVFAAGFSVSAYGESPDSKDDHVKKMMDKGGGSNYTLVQVMDDLASQISRIQTGILKGNRLMIKQGARAIAEHPKPKGGLKPYLKKNVGTLKRMAPEVDKLVHKTAAKMAESAETESIQKLQEMVNIIIGGCIKCHKMFRD